MNTPSPTSRPGQRSMPGRLTTVSSFAILALLVITFLFLLISLRDGAEAAMSNLANLLPVGYAFAVGMIASVNPCGFFMLPSYVSYHLGTEEAGYYENRVVNRAAKALLLGGVATAGFVLVFAAIGSIISTGDYWLATVFPYAGVAIGAAMMVLGLWLLFTRRSMGITAASRVSITPQRKLRNVLLFGVGYAVGSLSCTLPVFLVVLGGALATRGFAASFGQFIGYALGMGTILIAVTMGAALFRGAVARWLRTAIPYVHRMSELFFLAAGSYLIYYWVFYADFLF